MADMWGTIVFGHLLDGCKTFTGRHSVSNENYINVTNHLEDFLLQCQNDMLCIDDYK